MADASEGCECFLNSASTRQVLLIHVEVHLYRKSWEGAAGGEGVIEVFDRVVRFEVPQRF